MNCDTVCKVCSSNKGEVILDVSNYSDTYLDYLNIEYKSKKRYYKECKFCKLVYRSIFLEEDEKKRLYKSFRDKELRNETHKEYFKRISELPKEESENYEKYEFLKDFIVPSGKHMDVGGGLGVFSFGFLKYFEKWSSIVVEPTEGADEIANENDIVFYNIYLNEESISLIGNNFDLITVNHVIEHVDDPIQFLKTLKKFLSKEGILYIEMPSTLDIGYLDKSHDRFMCQHEVIYNNESLNLLAKKANYDVIYNNNFIPKRGRNNVRAILKP